MPEDMTALTKSKLNQLGYKIRSDESQPSVEKITDKAVDEPDLLRSTEPASVAEIETARLERKSISLEATLRKLEEQKKTAFDKIDQFTSMHESACVERLSSLLPEKANLDSNINFEVQRHRESVLAKIKSHSESAQTRIKETAATYKSQLNAQLGSLNSFIESAKNDAGIYKQFNQMNLAAESFASNYKSELVRLLDNNMGEVLSEQTKRDLNKIRTWNQNQIEEHKKYFELTLEQIKQYCANLESALEDFVNVRCEQLKRLCDQQMDIISLLDQRLSEAASLADRAARHEFTMNLEKMLAEHGLPFVSEQKSSSREFLHSLVQKFSQELESLALDSLKEININLENNKQRLSSLGEVVESLRSSFDKEARIQLKEQLAALSEHLDEKSAELKEFFTTIESEDTNSQKRIIKRLKHIRQIGLAIITSANEKEQLAVRKLMDSCTQQQNLKASLDIKQIKEEFSKQIESYANRRVAPRKNLEDKLEKLTQMAESLVPDYL